VLQEKQNERCVVVVTPPSPVQLFYHYSLAPVRTGRGRHGAGAVVYDNPITISGPIFMRNYTLLSILPPQVEKNLSMVRE